MQETILKILLDKCTTAVAAIAIGKGKNSAKAGINNVPKPNPEKKVKADTKIATLQMNK